MRMATGVLLEMGVGQGYSSPYAVASPYPAGAAPAASKEVRKRDQVRAALGRHAGRMTHRTDTFAAFVAVLAEGLDSDLDGTAFADRLHLSRHHLDRIVSSVAGEPPQALRRRILLERAAYRLISTKRTVIDVATEATA